MSHTYYDDIAHTLQYFTITYNNRLFNHYPMTIVSLEAFGATKMQLQSFTDYYSERLSPSTNKAINIEVNANDNNDYELDELQNTIYFYKKELEINGIAHTLAIHLSLLIDGIGAGNFYAINRLASAVSQKNTHDIAVALALWKTLHIDLGELGGTCEKRPTSLLRHVSKLIGHIRFSAGNITDRMLSVTTLIDYQQTPHQPSAIDFKTIASAAATIYKMSGDFTMLHSVTACWSFYQLLPFIEDETKALRYLWQAIVVAYLSAGSPAMTITDKVILSPWVDILEFCCQSNNEHLIDLCRACQQLYEHTHEEIFHQLAARYVSLYAVEG